MCATCTCFAVPAVSQTQSAKRSIDPGHVRHLLQKAVAQDPWKEIPDGSRLAWAESYLLHALVDMYIATRNDDYLKTVAERGDRMISRRDDRRGVTDGSGYSRPAWSMGLKYVVAAGELTAASGEPVIAVRSTPSAYNNSTVVRVIPGKRGTPHRFSLMIGNDHYKRYEEFTDLSMDPESERFVVKVVNDPLSPYSCRAGTFSNTPSHLIRVEVKTMAQLPEAQEIQLAPVPLAYMGYLGVVYDPLMRFAELVKAEPHLSGLAGFANRFVQAAEESYRDAAARLWRNGPAPLEGYYVTCERGESFPADNVGQPFNFLAKHVCVELALFRLTGKQEYMDRSKKMVNLFRNRLRYDPAGDLYIWNYWYEPMTTTGWTAQDSLSSNVGFFPGAARVEDISHAALNMAMAVAAHRMGFGFDDSDMRRFANTLLKNVLTPSRDGNRRTVDGKGEYPAYFNALGRWLELSAVHPEVYHAIRQTYLNKGEESLHFMASLLKWEQLLSASAMDK